MSNREFNIVYLNAPPARFDRLFAAGSTIQFWSSSYDGNPEPPANLDITSINLEHGHDILLQISIRRGDNRIDLDTFRTGRWDRNPQSISLTNVFSGPSATFRITATATSNSYQISFDQSPVIHTFRKRINVNATAASYTTHNQRSVFSSMMPAAIFGAARSGQFISSIPFFWNRRFWHVLSYASSRCLRRG